jgi:hypothetical protein
MAITATRAMKMSDPVTSAPPLYRARVGEGGYGGQDRLIPGASVLKVRV